MSALFTWRPAFVMLLVLLVAGCGPAATATPVSPVVNQPPPSSTAMPATPAATQIPATNTPVPPTSAASSLSSGEGGLIAYASSQDGDFEIWVMGADGRDQRQLTDNDAVDWSPAWSPDGSRIAFVSNRDGNDEIYSMDAAGGDVRRLTQTADADESFPAWSPDGSQISFDSDRSGNWDVYVMASDGTNVRQLTDHPREDWLSSWSPDGQRIVFESGRDGNYEIYVMNADGSDQQRLTQNSVPDGAPEWSPDGSSIGFFSGQAGNIDIYTMDPDGANVNRLTDDPAEDSFPSWSPDGAQIVFFSGRDGNDEIFVMSADGRDVRQLTDNGAQNWAPAWSAAPKISAIGAFLDDLADQEQFSGVVLIALGAQPILQEAYGMADRGRGIPNQLDTKFNLGSMDKMFTAVAILQLVEQGELSLDAKIAEVLPDYPNQQVANTVTIHQLLTHTSGMGDWSDSERFPELHDQIRGVEDYMPLFVDTPLEFEPGTQFRYSNAGYIVLGLIVERVTGLSYYDYVRASIFEPSGMTNTAAYELDADVPNRAVGYTRQAIDGSELDELTDHRFAMPMRGGPSGGGFSTAEDLLAFRNALLDHRLLSPESTELLLEGKVRLNEQAQYAYGFFDRMPGNQRVVGHGGGAPGICDFMDIYLDLGYTAIVLSNSDSDCYALLEAITATLSE